MLQSTVIMMSLIIRVNMQRMGRKLSTTGWSSIELGGLKSIYCFRSPFPDLRLNGNNNNDCNDKIMRGGNMKIMKWNGW
jgi:hypothetical protein